MSLLSKSDVAALTVTVPNTLPSADTNVSVGWNASPYTAYRFSWPPEVSSESFELPLASAAAASAAVAQPRKLLPSLAAGLLMPVDCSASYTVFDAGSEVAVA